MNPISDIPPQRVVVAMSGGVDSSMAAALLRERGHEVIGVTMRLPIGPIGEGKGRACCSLEDVIDARRVAHALNIPFYVKDCHHEFETDVIDYFVAEYLRGRTPNPCILCNQQLKFRFLLEWALQLGASHLATGHYARVAYLPQEGRWAIRRGVDPRKDQSYFLFSLTQEQLRHALFPLGGHSKEEVREMARRMGLPVAEKAESQEICFIPDHDYPAFLEKKAPPGAIREGPIVDRGGKIVGRHRGLPFYTIGQRKGLGLSAGRPLYVTALVLEKNTLVVGGEEELAREEFLAEGVNWMAVEAPGLDGEAYRSRDRKGAGERRSGGAGGQGSWEAYWSRDRKGAEDQMGKGEHRSRDRKEAGVGERGSGGTGEPRGWEARVQVRHRHPAAEAVLTPLEGRRVKVRFREPQRAITPGQAAVFYRGDLLVGGGWIQM